MKYLCTIEVAAFSTEASLYLKKLGHFFRCSFKADSSALQGQWRSRLFIWLLSCIFCPVSDIVVGDVHAVVWG